ncbi:MAG: glycosyltransferase family 4 protein, partial [Thermoproteota archaeon]|nr:glycosyltransferase family 4 protein [Thermoproteota archaeon]
MRILFCNYEYPPLGGGGGIVNALLAEELAKQHEVTVLTSQGLGLPGEREENSVRVIRVPVLFRRKQATANIPSMLAYLPMGILAGKRLLKNTHYDVINTHFVLPTGPVGRALSRFAKIPQVLSVHGGDLYDPSKWLSPHRHGILRVWVRRLLQNADRIVGQSRNTLDNVRKFYDP